MAVGPKGTGRTFNGGALPGYFYRLPARAQRIWLKSDSIDHLELEPDARMLSLTAALIAAVGSGGASVIARAAQALADAICRAMAVYPVKVEVRGVRPHNTRGELQGIFYPRGQGSSSGAPLIILWMRTAQRHDVVKPRTFLRTLMHELVHHLDYAQLRLDESFHTAGFYRRESFLVRVLLPPLPGTPELVHSQQRRN
ncbi:MAG: hypothetical protein JO166_02320 [Deltaproteobacteria bacterium]|nr:hypothetical protein [Deltaproteobacteria bacterium]